MEKFFFYFNYQIEGLLGENTFAPDCAKDGKRCNFHDFTLHITGRKAPNKVQFEEPPTDQKAMRKLAGQMSNRKGKEIAAARLVNENVMSSLKDLPENKRYETLYAKTGEWVNEVESRISELPDDKKEKANKLKEAAKLCIDDVGKMRRAGFRNVELKEAKEYFNGQPYEDGDGNSKGYNIQGSKIPPEANGGVDTYSEIDLDKTFKDSEQGDLKEKLDGWRKGRTSNGGSAAEHVAVEKMVKDVHGCYP